MLKENVQSTPANPTLKDSTKKQKTKTNTNHKHEGFGVTLKSEFVLKSDRHALA